MGQGLARPGAVKRAAVLSFGVAGAFGFALAVAAGWVLLVVGAAAIAAGWFYTGGPRPYGYAGLGEVFVFVFFGVVATAGSTYVQTETVTWLALAASVPVGLLATALLVVNNLRDIPGDTEVGKRTLAVRLGDRGTRLLYVSLLVAAPILIVVVSLVGGRPWGVIGAVGAVAAAPAIVAVRRGAAGKDLIPVLGATGRAQLVCGLCFAIGLAVH